MLQSVRSNESGGEASSGVPPIRVVSIHGPHALSGVSTWIARLLEHEQKRHDWYALVVGSEREIQELGDFPGHWTGRVRACVWSANKKATTDRVNSLRVAIRNLRADVVVPNYVAEAYAAAGLERMKGVRTMGICHSRDYWYLELFQHAGDLLHGAWAVSDECGEMIRSVLDPRTELLIAPYGIRLPKEVRPLPITREPNMPIRLLYAGRLESSQKRAMKLSQLADSLFDRGVPFVLTIVGDGPLRARLQECTSSHQAAGRVRLTGMLSPDEVHALVPEHDALVLLSAYEGTPLAAIEAMMHGRPILVTTGCGGAADAVRSFDCGILSPVDDVERFAENIARLYSDRSRMIEMSLQARRAAEESFGIDLHVKLLERLIDTVIQDTDELGRESSQRQWRAILRATSLAVEGGSENVNRSGLRRWRSEFIEAWQRQLVQHGVVPEAKWRMTSAVTIRAKAPRVERPGAALLAAAVSELEREGCSRIAVYPAGRHSARNAHVIRKKRSVLCFVDDEADDVSPSRLHGHPVLTPRAALLRGADAIVISSDAYEDELESRAREWAVGLPVRTLYVPVRMLDRAAK